jgi:hypothetical protein
LIALGTIVLGASGTLNSVFGAMTAFAVTLLVGIVTIFAGFLVASIDVGSPARPGAGPAAGAPGAGSHETQTLSDLDLGMVTSAYRK